MDRPELWVFAGPNGAGKSTIADRYAKDRLPVVNPDNIARELPRTSAGGLDEREAGKRALIEREQRLAARETFAIETTLSGKSELNLMRDASAAGYKVNLIYVGIDSPELSAARVGERVQAGGHDVARQDTDRRYSRTMANLPEAMRMADRSVVLDNSGERHRLVLVREDNRTRYENPNFPPWAERAIPGELRRDPALVRSDQAHMRVVEATIDKALSHDPEQAADMRTRARLAIEKGAVDGKPAPTITLGRQPERVPEGAEKVSVMNGSRLHESYRDGQWTVQDSGPEGMLRRGVYRLDTAREAEIKDGSRYRGSVLHVSAKGIYQDHEAGVVRHDPARFQQKPSIGEGAVIEYGNGRAVLANRTPDRGPAPPSPMRSGPDRER
jgi:predicted ABC-type ATPase